MANAAFPSRQKANLPNMQEFPVGDGDWDSNRRYPIDLLVLHTEVGFKVGTEKTFGDPQSHVSAHYGVNQDGSYDHFVDESNVAYHAGDYATNQRSIGIEHEDFDQPNSPRPDVLYASSAKLVADICMFYNIPIDRQHIIRHKEVPYPTGCPDALDIDRIVREAQAIAASLVAPAQQPSAPQPTMDDVTKNSLQVLQDAFHVLTDVSGKPFGNLEGMTREVTGSYPTYKSMVAPDKNGNSPVVLTHDQFMALSIKSHSLDTVADYLGADATTRSAPDFGVQVVGKLKDPVVPPAGGGGNLPIFSDGAGPAKVAPAVSPQTSKSLFSFLGKLYNFLFVGSGG